MQESTGTRCARPVRQNSEYAMILKHATKNGSAYTSLYPAPIGLFCKRLKGIEASLLDRYIDHWLSYTTMSLGISLILFLTQYRLSLHICTILVFAQVMIRSSFFKNVEFKSDEIDLVCRAPIKICIEAAVHLVHIMLLAVVVLVVQFEATREINYFIAVLIFLIISYYIISLKNYYSVSS
jgi:hypothetical protein